MGLVVSEGPLKTDPGVAGSRPVNRTARLFFALWPEALVRDALVGQAAAGPVASPGVVPTQAGNLHLTLGFLGNVPRERLPEVLELAADVRAAPFSFTLERLEHWPGPGIYCLVPAAVPPGLPSLARQLRTALRGRGLPVDDRPYRPHVTLCRKARAPDSQQVPLPVVPIDWLVSDFVLAESVDDTGRSVYRILGRWPLQPDRPATAT